jgi:hypothetical protein
MLKRLKCANNAIPGRLGEWVKSALRGPIEVQNGRVERNAGLWVPKASCF